MRIVIVALICFAPGLSGRAGRSFGLRASVDDSQFATIEDPIRESPQRCESYCKDDFHSWKQKCFWVEKCDGCDGCQAKQKIKDEIRKSANFPIRGDVFLDDGWTKLDEQDLWVHLFAMARGESTYKFRSRKQLYQVTLKPDWRTGFQRNVETESIRSLRFFRAGEFAHKPDRRHRSSRSRSRRATTRRSIRTRRHSQHKTLPGLPDVVQALNTMLSAMDAKDGTHSDEITDRDVVRYLRSHQTSARNFAEACQDGGFARRKHKYINVANASKPSIFFVCHDDSGSGLDLCFHTGTTSLCKESRGTNLDAYPVLPTGQFEITFNTKYNPNLEFTMKGKLDLRGNVDGDLTIEVRDANADPATDPPKAKHYEDAGLMEW